MPEEIFINSLLTIIVIIGIFLLTLVMYYRYQVLNYLGKEFESIPEITKKKKKTYYLVNLFWIFLLVTNIIFWNNGGLLLGSPFVIAFSLIALSTKLAGQGVFQNSNIHHGFFYNDNGFLVINANTKLLFRVRKGVWDDISDIDIIRSNKYYSTVFLTIFLRNDSSPIKIPLDIKYQKIIIGLINSRTSVDFKKTII